MTERPVAGLPPVYVPHGYVPLKEALVRGAEMLKPMEDVRNLVFGRDYLAKVGFDPLREPPADVLDPFSWGPGYSSTEYAVLEEIRHRIRWFLAEGHLEATGQTPDGDMKPIPPSFWRTDEGANTLRFPSQVLVYSQIFFHDLALVPWLRTIPHWYNFTGVPVASDSNAEGSNEPPRPVKSVPPAQLRIWLVNAIRSGDPRVEAGKHRVFEAAKTELGEGVSWRSFLAVWPVATDTAGRPDLRRGGRKPASTSKSRKSTPP